MTYKYHDKDGYCMVYAGMKNGHGLYRAEHLVVAEQILGRLLPVGAQVHHVDETKTNNTPSNLVICPNAAYHKLLHVRTAALAICGHSDWRRCSYCGVYAAPTELSTMRGKRTRFYHAKCHAAYQNKWQKQ